MPAGCCTARCGPRSTGEIILVVASRDGEGNRSLAHRAVWVADRRGWWFEADNHDRMDLLPERRRYEPGDTAVFQVRMPFDAATALVTVEREGVMEARVERLTRREPVVRIPVEGHHAPNVFVSVLAVRGRVAGPAPTAMVDLGKPAFKLGTAEIRVGWRAHELRVSVAADRPVYPTRDTARIRVRAVTAGGQPPPAGAEVALAAVDEGLLELMANRSWDLLAAMMGRRGCEVKTATAQMQVVGKRHFGVKALPPGGGGGRQVTRELFDTLLAWQARVPLDANGEATVDGAAERQHHRLPHRRRRLGRRGSLRDGRDHDPLEPRSHGVRRSAAARAHGRPLPGDGHRAQRLGRRHDGGGPAGRPRHRAGA